MYTKTIGQGRVSTDKLQALKLMLPYGALIQIARDLDITRHAVEKVFAGKWENEAVIEAAIRIVEEKKAKAAEQEARIDHVLND